jgi:hypothetical protein
VKKTLLISGILIAVAAVATLGAMFGQTKASLATTQDNLAAKTSELTALQTQLNQTSNELTLVNNTLEETQTDLTETNDELEKTQTDLDAVNVSNTNLKKQLDYAIIARNAALDEAKELALELAAAQELADEADEALATLQLYKETFGEVFEGAMPWYIINDTEPPAWNDPGPFNNAPIRLYNLVNNPDAVNPTYAELLDFLRADVTDLYRYVYNYYMCGNFAETVHNNAEAAGIRAAVVFIQYSEGQGHAINAFVTTDKGLVYIDCTGSERQGPSSLDSIVNNMRIGTAYICTFLFPSGYYFIPEDKTVTSIEIYF